MADHVSDDGATAHNVPCDNECIETRHGVYWRGKKSRKRAEPCPFTDEERGLEARVSPVEAWSAPQRLEMRQTTPGNVRYHRARVLDLRVEEHLPIKVARTRGQQRQVTRAQLHLMAWDAYTVCKSLAESNDRIAIENEARVLRYRSGEKAWRKPIELITIREFFHFHGIVLLMGQLHLPQEGDYWEGSPGRVTVNAPLLRAIRTCMTHERFVELKHWLCFSDATASEEDSALHRLDWMTAAVFGNSRKLFSSGNHLSLDDQSIAFFGRGPPKRGPSDRKSAKYALPFYSLNALSGFTLAIKLMTKLPDDSDDPVSGAGVGAGRSTATHHAQVGRRNRVILDLVDDALPNPAGFVIAMDNEFTDYRLVDELSKRGILVTGTIKSTMLTASSAELKLAKSDKKALNKGILFDILCGNCFRSSSE